MIESNCKIGDKIDEEDILDGYHYYGVCVFTEFSITSHPGIWTDDYAFTWNIQEWLMVGIRGYKMRFVRLFEADNRFGNGFYLAIDSNGNHAPIRFTRDAHGWLFMTKLNCEVGVTLSYYDYQERCTINSVCLYTGFSFPDYCHPGIWRDDDLHAVRVKKW